MIMRKLLFGMAFAVGSFAAFAQDPAITFEDTIYDFGTIAEDGGNVTHEFVFTNTGDAPLMIVSATASCGCTRPSFPKKPVAPGKSDKIKVTYVPAGRPGEFVKSVTVKSNAAKNKTVRLKIKGTVTPKKTAADK